MTQPGERRGTRAERLAMPLARSVVKDLAAEHGACLRPVQLRRTDVATGWVEQVLVPCGHTLASVCPPCAERAKTLRAAQCREGWHLDDEPVIDPDPSTENQRDRITGRAEAQADRDTLAAAGLDTTDLDEQIGALDEQITEAGMRGTVLPARPRRHRSTRRRHDAAPLPRRKVSNRTVGKTYTAPDGKVFRPSLFVTLTCPSYGRVTSDGTPADPGAYDYTRAARDALHFAALFDRFIQNLRRYVGYDLQYFAAVEPQRRLAPARAHRHPRHRLTRRAARGPGRHLPPGLVALHQDHQARRRPPPGLGRDQRHLSRPCHRRSPADLGRGTQRDRDHDEPLHVARFGDRFDVQGVLAGSKDASRCIGYLTKYLTKHVGDCHQASTQDQVTHADRLAEALRYEPCSPTCANWLRYGTQPKNARPGLRPGCCKGKAHRREHLGYGGRRVLVSRKWSGKTLADHRADRKAWLTSMLGLSATDPTRYTWEPVKPGDPDHMPNG